MRIILGSSSKWRRKLWERHFGTQESGAFLSPDIDEKALRHEDAETLTLLIANAKADALVKRLLEEDADMDAVLVCMDQVVRCDGVIREKPESEEQAREFLHSYSSGSPAECVNGVVVHDLRSGRRYGANEVARVHFHPFPAAVVEAAISQRSIFDSAGAFAIEDPNFEPYVGAIDGSREAIIGLPLDVLRTLLARSAAPAALASAVAPSSPAPPRIPLPSELATGIAIRPIRPSDEEGARDLFASGMRETIATGLRQELRRLDATRGATLAAVAAAAALALPVRHVALVFGTALLAFAGTMYALPRKIADDYVAKSLATDMRSPCARYLGQRGACFFVAIDVASGAIAGSVAIEQANNEPSWQWRPGDVELRRMSVAPWARQRGVANALFAELLRFAEQTAGNERVVLSTSTLQRVAHDQLYPRLGFGVEGRRTIFGKVHVTYFALPLRTAGVARQRSSFVFCEPAP
jgi:septum formation protein